MTENQVPLPPKTKLNQFRIIKELGKGGFGMTYLAEDEKISEKVVIKEYFPDKLACRFQGHRNVSLLSSQEKSKHLYDTGLRRFEREAMLLGEFTHPNIVKVKSYFTANNTAYMVMSFLEGGTLRDVIKKQGRPFNSEDIANRVLPVLDGLKQMHNKDMLHFDLKPENIMLDKSGIPVLIDFGGARVMANLQSHDKLSSVVGSEGYSPTEQYSLAVTQNAATDLYALGMTIYNLAAPKTKLEDSQYRLTGYLERQIDPLKSIRDAAPHLNDTLHEVVEKFTRISNRDRPQSVDEALAILAPFWTLEKSSPEPSPTSSWQENIINWARANNIPKKIILRDANKLMHLRKLDLSNQSLSSIPKEICFLTSLEELDLSGNSLTTLPEELVNLSNLRILNISNNKIESLPNYMSMLTELQGLYLSNNHLRLLPDEIKKLNKLRFIEFENNSELSFSVSFYDYLETNDLIKQSGDPISADLPNETSNNQSDSQQPILIGEVEYLQNRKTSFGYLLHTDKNLILSEQDNSEVIYIPFDEISNFETVNKKIWFFPIGEKGLHLKTLSLGEFTVYLTKIDELKRVLQR